MPVIMITKSAVDAIEFPASGQVIYKDSQLKGFGVKVGTSTKTYIAEGTPNGRTRLVTIGRHGVITTEQARKKAQAILQDMREGVDPNKVKKQARAKQLTLREAAELYINGTKVRAARTTQTYRYALDYYLSDWLDRPLAEITRKDCYDRHQRIGRDHGHYVANNAMAVLRGIYNRALKQFEDLPPVNPTIAVDRFPQEKRDCAIPAEKLAEWYRGIRKLPSPIRQDFYLFLLYSGMRRQAALTMRWEDVDLEGATLFVPLPKGGKKRAFSLPLSTSMVEILKRRKEQNMIFYGADNPWVWPAQSGAGHITEPKLAPLDIKKMGMSFIMHALRHTFATCANAAGIGIYDLKLLMNHALSGDVTTVYVGLGEHLRRAQQRVTDYINEWMLPEEKAGGAVLDAGSEDCAVWSPADIWMQADNG